MYLCRLKSRKGSRCQNGVSSTNKFECFKFGFHKIPQGEDVLQEVLG